MLIRIIPVSCYYLQTNGEIARECLERLEQNDDTYIWVKYKKVPDIGNFFKKELDPHTLEQSE